MRPSCSLMDTKIGSHKARSSCGASDYYYYYLMTRHPLHPTRCLSTTDFALDLTTIVIIEVLYFLSYLSKWFTGDEYEVADAQRARVKDIDGSEGRWTGRVGTVDMWAPANALLGATIPMTSITIITLPATSVTPSGKIQDAAAKSPSTPSWVFDLVPCYIIASLLCYCCGACWLARRIHARRIEQQMILMRQQRPDWELYP
jgi:hypothetical protein